VAGGAPAIRGMAPDPQPALHLDITTVLHHPGDCGWLDRLTRGPRWSFERVRTVPKGGWAMRAMIIILATVMVVFLSAHFGAATADTCSDSCDRAYAACKQSCPSSKTDCFTKCINEHESCLALCK
jgi:hypothetical protein